MRYLFCGNQATHEWPESCVRAARRLGHEGRQVYDRTPQAGEVEQFLRAEVTRLLASDEGRTALMEAIFFHLAADWRPDLIVPAGIYNTWSVDALADVQEQLGLPVVLWAGDGPYVTLRARCLLARAPRRLRVLRQPPLRRPRRRHGAA